MVKMNWNLDYEETVAVVVNGTEFHVKKRIPYEKKMEFAEEYAATTAMLNDDGSAYVSPYEENRMMYCILKYYTDIELHEDDNVGWIFDFAIEMDMENEIAKIADRDMNKTMYLAERLQYAIVDGWKQRHSLQAAISNLLSDEALEKLAHAAPLNEELIDLLHMKEELQARPEIVSMAEFAKKQK